MTSLKVKQLSCQRGTQTIFAELTFEVFPGELLIVEGENGAGKSSLLRMLAGIATPFRGDVSWGDQSIYQAKAAYAQNLHYVSHQNGLKLNLTALENLQLMHRLIDNENEVSLIKIATLLRLDSCLHTLTRYLSAGQKRRVALSKLFLYQKPCWILDEPFTALDHYTQMLMSELLQNHIKNGGLCIMATHQLYPFSHRSLKLCVAS